MSEKMINRWIRKLYEAPDWVKQAIVLTAIVGFVLLLSAVFAPCAKAASVNFTWTAPTTNEDGSPLTDLGGYKLYKGISSGTYTESVDVGNVTAFSWDLGNVEDTTLFFNVTAYDDKGNESDYNGEVSVPFGANPPAPPTNLTVGQ